MNGEVSDIWQAMKESKYRNVLKELNDLATSKEDLDTILRKTLDIVVVAMHAEAGTLWFYDYYKTGKIYPRVIYGSDEVSNIIINPGEGITGNVIITKKAELVSDCHKDPRWVKWIDAKTGFDTKTMICVPLGDKDDEVAFGSIQIINKNDGSLFDEKDLDFAITLAKEVTKLFIELSNENIVGIITKAHENEIDFNTILGFNKPRKVKEALIAIMRDSGYNRKQIEQVVEYTLKIHSIINEKE